MLIFLKIKKMLVYKESLDTENVSYLIAKKTRHLRDVYIFFLAEISRTKLCNERKKSFLLIVIFN